MLAFQLPDDNPATREGITCYRCESTINIEDPEITLGYCFCQFECKQDLIVFSGENEREKDYFTLYYKSKDENATISFWINNVELTGGTYGTNISNGYIVDWTKVSNELGYGRYNLRIEIEEFGNSFEQTFGTFLLASFDLERADGTVKIKSFQSGSIESGFDFENENVPFEIRIPAFFGNRTKVDEFISNLNGRRIDEQVHDRWYYEYELEFDANKYWFVRLLLDNMFAGTTVEISDYNLFNVRVYNNLPVRQVETEIEEVPNTRYAKYIVKFKDALQNNIKHPYLG